MLTSLTVLCMEGMLVFLVGMDCSRFICTLAQIVRQYQLVHMKTGISNKEGVAWSSICEPHTHAQEIRSMCLSKVSLMTSDSDICLMLVTNSTNSFLI